MNESTGNRGLLQFVPEKYRRRLVYLGMYESEHRFLLMESYRIQGRPVGPLCTLAYRPAVDGSQWMGLGWDNCPCSGNLEWVIKRMDELCAQ